MTGAERRTAMTLVCVTRDARQALAWRDRREAGATALDVAVLEPELLTGADAAVRVAAAAGGGPYALCGGPEAAGPILAFAARTAPARYPLLRVFLVGTPPPDTVEERQIPLVLFAGNRDPVAPPDVVAGWRRHFGYVIVRVLDAGPDLLTSHGNEIFRLIEMHLRLRATPMPPTALEATP